MTTTTASAALPEPDTTVAWTSQWPSAIASYALMLVATISGVLLVILARRHSPTAVVLVILATVACGGIAWSERRTARLKLAPVVVAILIVFGVGVARPPRTSSDLWSYTMYGRIVSVHGESPYKKLPIDFPTDPLFKRVNPVWRRRASVFGPAYIAFAAGGTALAGDSRLGSRLFFQISAAIGAGAVLLLVWRRTRSPAALAWLGLHPVFGAVVNGGHNDIFVALGILIAAALVTRRRGWAAGFVIGFVALMKLTVLLALAGIVLWAWRQRERRVAVTCAITAGAMVVVGYLPILASAVHVLRGADKTVTPASLWNPLAAALVGHNAGRDLAHPLAPNATLAAIDVGALLTVAIVAVVLGWRATRRPRPDLTIGVTTASYTVAAEYALPWYAVWALPLLTERRPSLFAWIVWIQAAVMLAAVRLPLHPNTSMLDTIVRGTLTYAAPIACFIAFVVAGLLATRSPPPEPKVV